VAGFIQEAARSQETMFPELLDEYIAQDNPVRVIDAFVDGLDLRAMAFSRVEPSNTGRPGYHPSTMLKLYIYGHLNRIQSSRRLETETHRNVELMWLLGRLQPDFKTIADFRKDNGDGIKQACRQFVEICAQLDLFTKSMVAIDGSKFKAVNNKKKNDSQGSMKRRIAKVEKHISEYLTVLEARDKDEPTVDERSDAELLEKLLALETHLEELKEREKAVKAQPDKQISETDPDSRLMKQSTVGSLVGYNVQTAVDTVPKLIVSHEVTNSPVDRGQLLPIARMVKDALHRAEFTVLADRGYFKGTDIRSCALEGITTLVPKPKTSGNGAAGLFPRSAFKYDPENDLYVCPADEIMPRRHSSEEKGLTIITYYVSTPICRDCKLKSHCTVGVNRRVRRWEHEDILDEMAQKLNAMPDAIKVRAQTVEHPFGTLKLWMGARHFLMKRLENVRT
jgi:transposase